MKVDLHALLLNLALIFFLARIFGSLFNRFGIPAVLGEIFTGLLLGPSLLGWIEPQEVLKFLAEIGIILLLFEIGLEVDLAYLRRTGFQAFCVALLGALLPISLGFGVAYYFMHLPATASLFIGGTLAATSIGVTVRILHDLGHLETRGAQIVLAAAVVDDILGVLLLTLLYEFAETGTLSFVTTFTYGFYIFTFFFLAPLAAHFIALLIDFLARKLKSYDFVPSTILSLIFFLAYLAKRFGAPEILGAFTGGLAFSRRFMVPFAATLRVSPATLSSVKGIIDPLVLVFTPLFFVYVGLEINFRALEITLAFLGYFLLFSLLAIFTKVGAGLVIRGSLKEKIFVGLAMVPRGEVGIIFAEFGRLSEIFDETLYTIMIAVVAFTTLAAPFFLKSYVKKVGLFGVEAGGP